MCSGGLFMQSGESRRRHFVTNSGRCRYAAGLTRFVTTQVFKFQFIELSLELRI